MKSKTLDALGRLEFLSWASKFDRQFGQYGSVVQTQTFMSVASTCESVVPIRSFVPGGRLREELLFPEAASGNKFAFVHRTCMPKAHYMRIG